MVVYIGLLISLLPAQLSLFGCVFESEGKGGSFKRPVTFCFAMYTVAAVVAVAAWAAAALAEAADSIWIEFQVGSGKMGYTVTAVATVAAVAAEASADAADSIWIEFRVGSGGIGYAAFRSFSSDIIIW